MVALPPWFSLFCDTAADRLQILVKVLHASGLTFELIKTGTFRHVQVTGGRGSTPGPGEKVLIAHYDRVDGTPGANDNGASVLALVDYLRLPRSGQRLRVVFTDGEELSAGAAPRDQGAFALAKHWALSPGIVPFVFDMVGIGDTFVLGHLGEQLIRADRGDRGPVDLDDYAKLRVMARRFLATCGAGDSVEINTPFSDDLGFLLAGIPAVQISMLPRKEALAYRRLRAHSGQVEGLLSSALPPSWRSMHGPQDRPETLWPQSRTAVADLLERLELYPWGTSGS